VGARQLGVDALPLRGVGRRALGRLQLGDTRLELRDALAQDAAEALGLAAQLLLGDGLQPLVLLVDRVDDGLHASPLPFVTGAENAVDDGVEHRILYRYSPADSMKSATLWGTNPRIERPARTRARISVDETSTRRVPRRSGGPPGSAGTVPVSCVSSA